MLFLYMCTVNIVLNHSKKVVGSLNFESKDIMRSYFKHNSNDKFIYFMDVDGTRVRVD